jgi:hypothetical protein
VRKVFRYAYELLSTCLSYVHAKIDKEPKTNLKIQSNDSCALGSIQKFKIVFEKLKVLNEICKKIIMTKEPVVACHHLHISCGTISAQSQT